MAEPAAGDSWQEYPNTFRYSLSDTDPRLEISTGHPPEDVLMSTESNDLAVETGENYSLTRSDQFRLLADEQRRTILEVLADTSTPIDLEELARVIADDAEAADQLAIVLHHKHLPLMADLQVIEYDRDRKQIETRMPDIDRLTL